jgi:hypothetical protein
MAEKMASELAEGDTFIDPRRAGRRPATVVDAPRTLDDERVFVTLDDDTKWSPWCATYDPMSAWRCWTAGRPAGAPAARRPATDRPTYPRGQSVNHPEGTKSVIRDYYNSEAERRAAIANGETSARRSTVRDGHRHYAVVRVFDDGGQEIANNLTHTPDGGQDAAERLARRRDHGPFSDGVAGYYAARIR